MYKKNQHILLLVRSLNSNKNALNHALKIAHTFNSKVLVANTPFSNNRITHKELENYISNIPEASAIQLNTSDNEPNQSIKQLNIIFLLVEVDNKKDFKFFLRNNIFHWILNAKIPTFLIGNNTSLKTDYSNIILPIDHKKESKEKMIWASYFGRFNESAIHLIPAKEKEDSFMKSIRNTLLFTKKMFSQFNFEYKILKSECSSKHIDEEAFTMPTTNESDLVILMTGKIQGIFLLRFNSIKIKHLLNSYANPILLINPMKDYYLPCEG